MTRGAFLAWLLELIRRAPEPTVTRPLSDALGDESGIEVVVGGKTFRIDVEEVD